MGHRPDSLLDVWDSREFPLEPNLSDLLGVGSTVAAIGSLEQTCSDGGDPPSIRHGNTPSVQDLSTPAMLLYTKHGVGMARLPGAGAHTSRPCKYLEVIATCDPLLLPLISSMAIDTRHLYRQPAPAWVARGSTAKAQGVPQPTIFGPCGLTAGKRKLSPLHS